jgi:hypothetical protein
MRSALLVLILATGCGSTLGELAPHEFQDDLPKVEADADYASLDTEDEPGRLLLVPSDQVDVTARPDGGAERVMSNLAASAQGNDALEVVLVFRPVWPRGKQWPRMKVMRVALFGFVPGEDEEEDDLEDAILEALEGAPLAELTPKAEEPGVDYATARFPVSAGQALPRYLVSCFALDKVGAAVRRVLVVHAPK